MTIKPQSHKAKQSKAKQSKAKQSKATQDNPKKPPTKHDHVVVYNFIIGFHNKNIKT
jgi:hypothetical protein